MDRSRRAVNPQNYNDDGTIKKCCKSWIYSNHYKKLKAKHSELEPWYRGIGIHRFCYIVTIIKLMI